MAKIGFGKLVIYDQIQKNISAIALISFVNIENFYKIKKEK